MTAHNGALVLIKAGDGGSPESFTTIGGLRTSEILLAHHSRDATTIESGAWQQLADGAGLLACHISGSGLFTDSASEETVRGHAFSGSANNYRFIFANGNNITGPFIITAYQRSGNHDGEEQYALTLESAGTITFATS
jgi:TP901-1 family phage major tail protein